MKKSAILLLSFAFASCTYQSANSIDQKDVNENNEYVYGHKDSAAVQLKNTYPAKAELGEKAEKLKEKMYGKAAMVAESAPVAPTTTAADTTKK
ncbi:MAG: hypothetical protein ACRCVT_08955 [Leadbetterella sp.]